MKREDDHPFPEIIEIPIRRHPRPTQPLAMNQQRKGNHPQSQLRRTHYPIVIDRFVPNVPVERAIVQSRERGQVKHKRSHLWRWLAWLVERGR